VFIHNLITIMVVKKKKRKKKERRGLVGPGCQAHVPFYLKSQRLKCNRTIIYLVDGKLETMFLNAKVGD
jgi:hypothetical protein